ncbi:serpin family protein [Actinomadura chibensis]|uniref:Serpin family protein n=1 Tax=Actinomadura chibensis TaxID=392828 RepID=A0A5D0NVD9_9ACTN|nr:serpin family protein [Actinomadura chibensis]TYB48486.1 serpin family protein [Actinomadura chibensis]
MASGTATGDLVRASNALTARWARDACDGTTTVLSGAGAWPLLAFLAAAAREPGRGELQRAVGVDATGAERHARDLLALLAGGTAATAALGVWTLADLPVEQWWRDAVPAEARGELTGDPAADQARLDEWVARNTAGRLTAMPVEVRDDTGLVLATALSIATRWREPFEDVPLVPRDGPWAGRDRPAAGLFASTAEVDRLALAEATPAGPVTLLAVPGEDDVDVILCLGEEGRPAGEVVAGALAAADGRHGLRQGAGLLSKPEAAPGLRVRTVAAFQPGTRLDVTAARFDVAASHDLLARAGLFGLATVSTPDPRGHLPGISPAPLAVAQAVQDVNAAFSAEGFRAAAVTAMSAAVMGAPMAEARALDVRFDRPFGFFARHRPSGLVLLAGWVAEPRDWPDGTG